MIIRKNAITIVILFICAQWVVNILPTQTAVRPGLWPTGLSDVLSETNPASSGQTPTESPAEITNEGLDTGLLELQSPINRDTMDQFPMDQTMESQLTGQTSLPTVTSTSPATAQPTPIMTAKETKATKPLVTEPAVTETTTTEPAVTEPVATTTATTATPTAQPTEQPSTGSLLEDIRVLANQARIAEGLSPLSSTAVMDQAAACRASEISVSLSHTRPDGRPFYTVFADFNVTVRSGAENFSSGTADAYTAADIVNGWLSSPVHRSNLLNSSYTQTGFGIYNANGQFYIVQLFAS